MPGLTDFYTQNNTGRLRNKEPNL